MKIRDECHENIMKLHQYIGQLIKGYDHSKPIKHTDNVIKSIITQMDYIYQYGYAPNTQITTISNNNNNNRHYWDKISEKLNHMDSVKFIISNPQSSNEENAKFWLLIELSNICLHKAIEAIYEIKELRLCWKEDSILRKHFKEIYDILCQLTSCDYVIESDMLMTFYEKYPYKAPIFYLEKLKYISRSKKNSSNNNEDFDKKKLQGLDHSNSNYIKTKTGNNDISKFKMNLERFNKIINDNIVYNGLNSPCHSTTSSNAGFPDVMNYRKNVNASKRYDNENGNMNANNNNEIQTLPNEDNDYFPNNNLQKFNEMKTEEDIYNFDDLGNFKKSQEFKQVKLIDSKKSSIEDKNSSKGHDSDYGNYYKKILLKEGKKYNNSYSSMNFLQSLKSQENLNKPISNDYDNNNKLVKSTKLLQQTKKESYLEDDNQSYGHEDDSYYPDKILRHKYNTNNINTNTNHNSSTNSNDNYDRYETQNTGNNTENDYPTTNDITPKKYYMQSPSGINNTFESQKKTKNSEELYIERYKAHELYEYKEKPFKQSKPEDQNNKCHSCLNDLNSWIMFIKPTFAYCHYSGYWYCSNCISKEKRLIPWYILEKWEFKTYTVSKESKEELDKLYTKCIINIDLKMDIVKKNKILYDALVMKRQLHLIFDMLCSTSIIMDFIESDGNLLLKQNLFSLKNLNDINSGSLYKHMENWYISLFKHFMGPCQICLAKGKICTICQDSNNKLFPFDIKNTAFCPKCKKFYHSRCLQVKKCIECIYN